MSPRLTSLRTSTSRKMAVRDSRTAGARSAVLVIRCSQRRWSFRVHKRWSRRFGDILRLRDATDGDGQVLVPVGDRLPVLRIPDVVGRQDPDVPHDLVVGSSANRVAAHQSIGVVLDDGAGRSGTAGGGVFGPVSYTHLRAHETRHD